jgi:Mg2+/Co2+ transporter CorB
VDNLELSLIALIVLLALSALFSMSETAMMASNRYRLRHLAKEGHRGARLAISLLERTDRLLGAILIGNNLVNTAVATIVSIITIELFGEDHLALGIATLLVTFAILVFAEISPKLIGAAHADRLVLIFPYILSPFQRVISPAIWFINLFANGLLSLLQLRPKANQVHSKLTPEELRTLVMESRELIPPKHATILLNLFELSEVAVEDLMTPRGQIEFLDVDQEWNEVRKQIFTSHHSRLPVCNESLDNLIGILPVRRLVGSFEDNETDEQFLREQIQQPYYIPAGTPVFSQLTFFQENRQRVGLVVDEYGEILGLITLEDIIEEIVGEFTTSLPGPSSQLTWDQEGTVLVEGGRSLREINRHLGIDFSLEGPKTLNGLIVEYFQDIPESGVSLKIGSIAIEIIQTQDRSIKTVRLYRPIKLSS